MNLTQEQIDKIQQDAAPKGFQKILCWVFSKVYDKWLWNDWYEKKCTVEHVYGWRSARVCMINNQGKRAMVRHIMPCFWWFD